MRSRRRSQAVFHPGPGGGDMPCIITPDAMAGRNVGRSSRARPARRGQPVPAGGALLAVAGRDRFRCEPGGAPPASSAFAGRARLRAMGLPDEARTMSPSSASRKVGLTRKPVRGAINCTEKLREAVFLLLMAQAKWYSVIFNASLLIVVNCSMKICNLTMVLSNSIGTMIVAP